MIDKNIKNEKSRKLSKARKTQLISASSLVILILMAFIIGSRTNDYTFEIKEFWADKYEADVGEVIEFNWSIIGEFSCVYIIWGDGSPNSKLENDTFGTTHNYSTQGIYTVFLNVRMINGEDKSEQLGSYGDIGTKKVITIKNEPPGFDISLSKMNPYEDEDVNINVTNLKESDHDLQPGVLKYIYDFADGSEQNITSENSITHSWSNAGKYPISITVIDDQGALSKTTKYITVINKPPEAAFTLGAEIPSTFSFSSDVIGKIPLGWVEASPGSRDAINVVDGKDSHMKVLKITGSPYPESPRPSIKHDVSAQNFGTIEYYFYSSNVNDSMGYLAINFSNSLVLSVYPKNGKWKYETNKEGPINIDNCDDPQNNAWTHIRIDFLISGDYLDLYEHSFRVIINGKISKPHYLDPNIKKINIISVGSLVKTDTIAYIDSIGFSWDPNYNVGDNYHYLSSQFYATHDWRQDRIGEQPKSWELGIYDSEVTGKYYGSDSFDNQTIYSEPLGWTVEANSPNYAQIYENIFGHHMVVKFRDQSQSDNVAITQYFDVRSTGTIEFWWLHETKKPFVMRIHDGYYNIDNVGPILVADNYYYRAVRDGGYKNDKAYKAYSWDHIRIDFDCASDKFNFTVNGQFIHTYDFWLPKDHLNGITFLTDDVYGDDVYGKYRSYVDAVGYSWDPNYEIGDNKFSPLRVITIDAGGDYKEVIEFSDYDIEDKIEMQEQIDAQIEGTIEFYTKTKDINNMTWAITLCNEEDIELSIAIDNGQWQYSLGNFYNAFTEFSAPENNIWYHIRIDFNKSIGIFKIYINDTESGDYNLNPGFNYINLVKVESGQVDKGKAWIDAIGYSWDPQYNIGDNKLSIITYPEKSFVMFSAADSTDSEKDYDSLRYYWNYGDGTSGFGKYVTHEYKQSGIYNVSLAVKDDNGDFDSVSQLIRVHNKCPDVNIIKKNDTIILNEGENIAIDCISMDDISDWAELMYYWDFNLSTRGFHNTHSLTGGWKQSHLYIDDFMGYTGVKIVDPEGAYDTDYISVIVKNVDPLISIYDASFISNISFEISRNDISKSANFTFGVYANEINEFPYYMNFMNSLDYNLYSITSTIDMMLSKDWKIIVNSTELPNDSWFQYNITLRFLNGAELILSSDKYFGGLGSYGNWTVNLNPYWFDSENYSFKYPISLKTHIWDPSTDDINLTISYEVNHLLNISCSNDISALYTHYPATYSFENDAVGSNPADWITSEPSGTSIQVIDYLDGHSKIAEITDTSGENYAQLENAFSNKITGTVEFWWRIDDKENSHIVYMCEGTLSGVCIETDSTNIRYLVGPSTYYTIQSYSADMWYHFRIDFNCTADNFDLYIDGVLKVNGGSFRNPRSYINNTIFLTDVSYTPLFYVDAIGYSWDPNYQIGDNYLELSYLGTYSFENDVVGSNPSGWIVGEEGGTVNVINELDGHSKVLELNDMISGNNQLAQAYVEFNSQSFGTVEFWLRTDDATNPSYFNIREGDTSVVWLTVSDEYFKWYDGSYHNIQLASDNTWYHIKMDYECTTEGYKGLSQYKWRVYINGTVYGDFNFNSNQGITNRFTINTGSTPSIYKAYIDAIGFSWDPNYQIGDNLYRHYITNYQDNEVNYIMDLYKIDSNLFTKISATFEMIDENYNQNTFPVDLNITYHVDPFINLYDILENHLGLTDLSILNCVYSNNLIESNVTDDDYGEDNLIISFDTSSGINFNNLSPKVNPLIQKSGTTNRDIYFDIILSDFDQNLQLNYTRNFNYLEQGYRIFTSEPTGEYLGSNAFENFPIGWLNATTFPCFVEWMDTLGEHDNLIRLIDLSGSASGTSANTYYEFPSRQTGNISFWWRVSDINGFATVTIRNNGAAFVHLKTLDYLSGPGFYAYEWGGDIRFAMSASSNIWYYHKIVFNTATRTYDWYINNIKRGSFEHYDPDFGNSVNQLVFSTDTAYMNYDSYIDGVALEWDTNYTINDNVYPTSMINETIILKLKDMNLIPKELFDTCNFTYSIKTSNTQEIKLYAYNFIQENWSEFDSFLSNENSLITRRCNIHGHHYLNDNHELILKVFAINQSVEQFTLNLTRLDVTYNWSNSFIDLGYFDSSQKLEFITEISNQNLYLYNTNVSYNYQGQYLVSITANDGLLLDKTGDVIDIINPTPYAKIRNFINETIEDKEVEFSADIYSYGTFANETRLIWNWSDGYYSYTKDASHAWATSGIYTIILFIKDCFGNTYVDKQNITVLEAAPEILGPFTFYGLEGQAVTLDVEIYDSHMDEFLLGYRWYNDKNIIVSLDKKPSLIFDDGTHYYRVEVEDSEGKVASADLTIFIEDSSPVVLISDYMYYGMPNNLTDFDDKTGKLLLTAYSYDTIYDIGKLDYYWKISDGENSYSLYNTRQDTSSSIHFKCTETKIYTGEVKVIDSSGKTSVANFIINSFIDSNFNRLSDEFEQQLADAGDDLYLKADYDHDYLTNGFELGISQTNISVPDTDGDGLWDGYNDLTGLGEMFIGTDPRYNDTDHDLLSDSFEFFGWNFTNEYNQTFIVNSDPCVKDSDNDGLTDYQEFIAGSHPRMGDTDNDGLLDSKDPHPNKWDGDGDSLSDYKEVIIGSNPNNTDSDEDGLSDGEEVLVWQTNPISADSDHDFLADNAETQSYEFKLEERYGLNKPISLFFKKHCINPISAQISFTIAFGEYGEGEYREDYGIEGYGTEKVPDLEIVVLKSENELILFNSTTNGTEDRYYSRVIDLKEVVEKQYQFNPLDFDYYGKYIIRINNTEAKCSLEEFKIDAIKLLDPNNDDTDGDGIMDGVETSLLTRGIDKIDFQEIYSLNNLSVDVDPNTYEQFSINIPSVGRVYDAFLIVNITSETIVYGSKTVLGNVYIEIIKDEINCSIEDTVLLSDPYNPYNIYDGWQLNKEIQIDLSQLLADNKISEYYGTYNLRVEVNFDSNAYNFSLNKFYIEIDSYIMASSQDTDAWITDPADADTDDDGWSDEYEIYGRAEPTNPLAWDTDGDGIKDSEDIDPLYNIILEITLSEGHIGDLPEWYLLLKNPPTMQMTADYKIHGEKLTFVTTHKDGSDVPETKKFLFWTAKWMGTAIFNSKFYVDIEDDSSKFKMKFSLWDNGIGAIDQFWDTKRTSYEYKHDLYEYPRGKDNSEKIEGGAGDKDWIEFNVKTIGLNHTNTIAIYPNETVFNGHYNEYNRMHLVQVKVNTPPEEKSPFIEGLNTIVISTDAFMKTKMNSLISNSTADYAEMKKTVLAKGNFMSLDRNDLPESASIDIESIFIIECNATEAREILDLLTIGIINDTSNETGIINQFASTKLDNFRVEMMNLPSNVLKIIPIINLFTNSRQGSMPKEAGEWWADLAEQIIKAVVGFFVAIALAIVEFIKDIAEKAKELLEKIIEVLVSAALWLIELLIKAALLILVWIIFAITLLIAILVLSSIAGISSLLSIFMNLNISAKINEVIVTGDFDLIFKYEIGEQFNNFLELNIPTIELYVDAFNFTFEYKMSFFSTDFRMIKFPVDLFNRFAPEGSFQQTAKDFPHTSDTSNVAFDIWDFIDGLGFSMGSMAGIVGIVSAIIGVTEDSNAKLAVTILGALATIATIGFWIADVCRDPTSSSPWGKFGMGIGYLICGIVFLISGKEMKKKETGKDPHEDTIKNLEYIDLFFGLIGAGWDIADFFIDTPMEETTGYKVSKAIFSLSTGIYSISLAMHSLFFLERKNKKDRDSVALSFGVTSIVLGIVFITWASIELYQQNKNSPK